MTETAKKLCSIRHYCFIRGVLGRHPDGDFRQAFRTVNSLYNAERNAGKPGAKQREKKHGL